MSGERRAKRPWLVTWSRPWLATCLWFLTWDMVHEIAPFERSITYLVCLWFGAVVVYLFTRLSDEP